MSADPPASEARLSWVKMCFKALTRPSPSTFRQIASQPNAGLRKAFIWMMAAVLINVLTAWLLVKFTSFEYRGVSVRLDSSIIVFSLWVNGFVAAILITASAWFSQAIATAWGGIGSFKELVFPVAVYAAPIMVITELIILMAALLELDSLYLLVLALGLYAIALNISAIKAVNRLGWGPAIASCAPLLFLVSFFLSLLILAILDSDLRDFIF